MLETITPELAAEIETALRRTHNVTRVESTPRRLTVHHQGPATMGLTSRQMLDNEHEIVSKWCNEPHLLYADATTYRFTLACN